MCTEYTSLFSIDKMNRLYRVETTNIFISKFFNEDFIDIDQDWKYIYIGENRYTISLISIVDFEGGETIFLFLLEESEGEMKAVFDEEERFNRIEIDGKRYRMVKRETINRGPHTSHSSPSYTPNIDHHN